MAHHRKALAAAAALNTAIFVVEAIAGFQADSLSLIMDSIHNFSDELALVFLYLAFLLARGVSRSLLRSANVFNSVGLVVVSGLLLWQAIERLFHPVPVAGITPGVECAEVDCDGPPDGEGTIVVAGTRRLAVTLT